MTVYLDLVIFLNFAVDLLLLMAVKKILGYPLLMSRSVPAALLGGIYGGICVLPGWMFLGNLLWRIVCLGSMAALAFGVNRTALRAGALFCILSFALGGAAGLTDSGMLPVLITAVGLLGVCYGCLRNDPKQNYCAVQLTYNGRKYCFTALQDTGNTLHDPVTGKPVLVAGADIAYSLLQLTEKELSDPVETVSAGVHKGLRLIPYRSVGQPGGFLLSVRLDEVRINNKIADVCVAFAPQIIGRGEAYQGLTGGVI